MVQLPKPIELYFASENTHDVSALELCFAADAVVRDEGRTIRGLDAIKAWRTEAGGKYRHTVEPLAIVARDGKSIVTGKITGNFPGSPIELDHVFEINGDGKIVALEFR
jgi:hypothetical protein